MKKNIYIDNILIKKLVTFKGWHLLESKKYYDLFSINEKNICNLRIRKTNLNGKDYKNVFHALNEAQGNGFTDSGSYGTMNGEPYCEYRILPLTHRFEQKTKEKYISRAKNKNYRIIHTGDFVCGKSIAKGNQLKGYVLRFKRDMYNVITGVYILAMDHGQIAILDPDTVRMTAPVPVRRIHIKMLNAANLINNNTFTSGSGYA